MLTILIVLALWWWGGARLSVPVRVRVLGLGVAALALVAVHLQLPHGHPLRAASGGSLMPWGILAGVGALVFLYRLGLAWLRQRANTQAAQSAPPEADAPLFSETELERYARHIVLHDIGGPGQGRLKRARVLVVGAGGLGAPAMQYLAAAGVGTIGIVDDDVVENSNLQRQVIHRDEEIGAPKVASAARALVALNPYTKVQPHQLRLTAQEAQILFRSYDLVLDGSDNYATRAVVNEAAASAGIPLISGALSQWEGQVSLFDPARGAPCYACLFPQAPAAGQVQSCAQAGVFAPLPGIVGTIMAAEALKHLSTAGTTLRGRLLLHDCRDMTFREIRIHPSPDCPVCGGR